MALNKIRQLDRDSFGVTLPKGDLRVEGVVDEDGELTGDHHLHMRHVEEGRWSVELIEDFEKDPDA